MSEDIHEAIDRVRRFLDAREGHFPIDVLAVVTRTGDRLLASDLRALVEEVDPDRPLTGERGRVRVLGRRTVRKAWRGARDE